jgi:hypothetical protein
MTMVTRLPAIVCKHYVGGRCHYEETLNPGYDPGYRCVVLDRLQRVYDSFLTQADAFCLDDALAANIWANRFRELCRSDTGCQAYEPDDTDAFPGCAYLRGDVCLLRLPECGGRCRNYTLNSRG